MNHPLLSVELKRLATQSDFAPLTLGRLAGELDFRGGALFTLLLALPFFIPVPLPGVSIPLGFLIFVGGIRVGFGMKTWIPNRWKAKPLPIDTLKKILLTAARIMEKTERLSKPRGWMVQKTQLFQAPAGLMIAICGALLALPLPPGTNFPPSLAIAFLSIALLELDTLFFLIGTLFFIINLALFSALAHYGVDAVHALIRHWS